ncbi:MAG: hypothetical protein HY692_08335 [Cyanobacteria bacterium NC_groundwater_1444_Ag_S-0.65um_54_12]|nr:hypothetical protein [Cyanobacteria bacterium NC_groundwater_1444_Ag_S-0.65um_54_12]
MAEAFFRFMAQYRAAAASAGLQPATEIDPVIKIAMQEVGLLLSGRPQMLGPALAAEADRVIAIGCDPLPDQATDDWKLPNPVGLALDEVRRIREQVRARVEILVADLNVARPVTRNLPSDAQE